MRIERLDERHHVEDFTCGEKSLDLWLRVHALANQARDLSRTYVLIDDAERIVGYYSLTMGGVVPSDLPRRYGRGLPAIEIGMVLIGRLAVGCLGIVRQRGCHHSQMQFLAFAQQRDLLRCLSVVGSRAGGKQRTDRAEIRSIEHRARLQTNHCTVKAEQSSRRPVHHRDDSGPVG